MIAAIPGVQEKCHLTNILAIAPSFLYAYCIEIGALLGTAACEMYGHRIFYHVTVPLSLLFTILGGCSQNYATLATSRSLAGLFSGPWLTVGVGILNDLWDLCLEKTGTSFVVLFVLFVILVTGRANGQRGDRYASFVALEFLCGSRPLHMMFVEPIIFPTGLVLAVTQSVVFAYYVGYAILFEKVDGFSQWNVGMAFCLLVVGSLLAVLVVALFDKLAYQKARVEALRLGKTVTLEKRLYPAKLGSITLPISLFW
jgi:MFS family permease